MVVVHLHDLLLDVLEEPHEVGLAAPDVLADHALDVHQLVLEDLLAGQRLLQGLQMKLSLASYVSECIFGPESWR